MKWYFLALPVAGLALYYLLKPTEKPTPEGFPTPALGPGATPPGQIGGIRARQYITRLDIVLSGWRAALPFLRETQRTLVRGTVEVVNQMAIEDAAKGTITADDLAAIQAKSREVLEEVGAPSPPLPVTAS